MIKVVDLKKSRFNRSRLQEKFSNLLFESGQEKIEISELFTSKTEISLSLDDLTCALNSSKFEASKVNIARNLCLNSIFAFLRLYGLHQFLSDITALPKSRKIFAYGLD